MHRNVHMLLHPVHLDAILVPNIDFFVRRTSRTQRGQRCSQTGGSLSVLIVEAYREQIWKLSAERGSQTILGLKMDNQ